MHFLKFPHSAPTYWLDIDLKNLFQIEEHSASHLHATVLTQAVIHIPAQTRAWDRPQFSPFANRQAVKQLDYDGQSLGPPGREVAGDIGIDAFKARLRPTNLFAPNVLDFDQKQNINNLLQEKNSQS